MIDSYKPRREFYPFKKLKGEIASYTLESVKNAIKIIYETNKLEEIYPIIKEIELAFKQILEGLEKDFPNSTGRIEDESL